jgi:DNA invertase Pin-like site-specific DNA recombinase
MIAAIYARKSSDNEAGVSRQVELARDFATAQGWTAPAEHVYTDNDVSGAIFRRPGLDALLLALASTPRPVDVLVVMDASRLGRKMDETLPLQLRIIATGCHIFHYQDGEELKLDTPVQKPVASVANFSHEDYRHQITLKTTAALRKKFAQGHVVGGRVYGYDNVEVCAPAGQRLHVVRQVNDVQAAVVRRIFALCAEGHGFTRIAKALNEEGVAPPRRSSGWAPTAVREILLRPLYRGEVIWNRAGRAQARHPECRTGFGGPPAPASAGSAHAGRTARSRTARAGGGTMITMRLLRQEAAPGSAPSVYPVLRRGRRSPPSCCALDEALGDRGRPTPPRAAGGARPAR